MKSIVLTWINIGRYASLIGGFVYLAVAYVASQYQLLIQNE